MIPLKNIIVEKSLILFSMIPLKNIIVDGSLISMIILFLPYLMIFLIPALFVFNPLTFKEKFNDKIIFIFIIFLILFVGSRVEVGGDWGVYLSNYYVNGRNFDFLNFSIRSDFNVSPEVFQIKELEKGIFLGFDGIVKYHDRFNQL